MPEEEETGNLVSILCNKTSAPERRMWELENVGTLKDMHYMLEYTKCNHQKIHNLLTQPMALMTTSRFTTKILFLVA